MGTSKRPSKKYKPPLKVWDKARIDRDKEFRKVYGFKNKRELWKVESKLRGIRMRARDLVGLKALNLGQEEERAFISSLNSQGLVKEDASVDDVLDLTLQNLLDRRLQTFVFKKGMARSIREARQLIVHRHIVVGDKVVDTPSYMVKRDDNEKIAFSVRSPVSSESHPIRAKKGEQ